MQTRRDTTSAPLGTGTKAVWPLAALCCLGIVGILIAGTIILALIPIYLPQKTAAAVSLTSPNDNFFLQYSADVPYASSVTGNVTNLAQVSNALSLGTSGTVTSGSAQAGIKRRRRALSSRRQKRTLQTNFLFIIKMAYSVGCVSSTCHLAHRTRLHTKLSSMTSIPNFSCTIVSGGVALQLSFRLSLVGIISTRPVGFAGESKTFEFVAIKSGAFNDPTIWADGIVPYGNCSVAITAGFTVTLPRPAMEIRMRQCDVYGALALGSGSSTFTFNFPSNIMVRSGGMIEDQTSNKNFLFPSNSIMTILSGGRFAAAGTILQTYNSNGPGTSVTLRSASGPFTCGMLPDGSVQSYNSVTFIAIQSGGFTSGGTFLGGVAPSSDVCSAGCAIRVAAGIMLSTADLNGVMTLSIDSIYVSLGATLQLGTPGSSSGFKFLSAIILDIFGQMSFVASGGNIMLPPNSNFDIAAGGAFRSSISISIQIFNPRTGLNIGSPQILGTSITDGTFTLIVGESGSFQLNGTAPAASGNSSSNSTGGGSGGGSTTSNSTTFVATKSGDLTDATVWSGGVAPYGKFSLSIPAGITITISGATLSLEMIRCDVSGTLALGSGSDTFTFAFPPTIIVRSGGQLLDKTTKKVFMFPSSSIIAILSGGGFAAAGTALTIVKGGVAGASFTVTSASGPFTCGMLPDGSIQTYNSVTAIAIQSGGFTATGTFLGGFAPSADICSGGCGIQVISGVTLSTADLNGVLNFQIISITVASGATFALGTPGASTGFKFTSAVKLSISGHMSFVGSGGNIMLPPGSNFNIAAGGDFSSTISVSIEIFDLLTGLAIGPLQTLGTLISGGTFTLSVSASGSVAAGGTASVSGGGAGSITFLANKSGDLTDATVWSGGVAPYGKFSLSIPAGITITISGATLSLEMIRCDVSGTLALGSGSDTFTFAFPPTIIVRSGGQLLDKTTKKVFMFPSSSIIAILSGGGFAAAGTALTIVKGGVAGASFTVTSASGPFTCGMLPDGSIQTYNSVTAIAIQSGGFTATGTFLGGFAPSADICSGGCGIQVISGVTLSTADLNGVLNFQIISITVASGATFALGTPGASTGFKFTSAVKLSISGHMSFVGSGGNIMLPPGSNFNIAAGGDFSSTISVSIEIFDLLTGLAIGPLQTLGTLISGGTFTLSVSASGSVTIGGTGGVGSTTEMPSSPNVIG
ncbi:unnamed protein product [Rotaria magnacalcarata]